ncbi:hypothetical protein [Amycolatopsis sp. NPDC051716]|uniref:hypothetical protein n=1 Tax=Amycolatopsis sp. NPDC051716 TaxID=3155804 RepID=UPI0034440FBD
MLWLLHIFVKRRRWDATYDEAEAPVGRLIGKYAPGAADATDLAANPFVRLERSIWELSESTGSAIASNPSRSGSWLKTRGARGRLRAEVAQLLNDPRNLVAAIEALLEEYFTPEVAEGIRAELGLDLVFSAPASSLRRPSHSVSKRVDLPEEETVFRGQFHLPANYENLDYDTRLRWQALMWLVQVRATNDNRIPSSQLSLFEFEGKRIALADRQRGIRKPKELDAALSIKTTYTPNHQSRPYEDGMIRDGLHRYKYAGDDPNFFTNVALRRAYEQKRPLIYFIGIASGLYEARFPWWIVADQPEELQVVISPDPPEGIHPIWSPWVQRGRHATG